VHSDETQNSAVRVRSVEAGKPGSEGGEGGEGNGGRRRRMTAHKQRFDPTETRDSGVWGEDEMTKSEGRSEGRR
jgi:hypothetical protein